MSAARNISHSENPETTHRAVLCIKIPVTEDMKTVSDFTNQVEHYYRSVGNNIAKFITETCIKQGFTSFNSKSQAWINELVANAYDAYAAYPLKVGSSLELKVVIKTNQACTIIKFKDNASGFIGYPKSEILDNQLICAPFSTKSKAYLGGAGVGLSYHINSVQQAGGTVHLKNRKKAGASIYSIFYHAHKNNHLPKDVSIAPVEIKSQLTL